MASCSYVCIYIIIYKCIIIYISVKMAAPWGSLTLLSYYLLCLHLKQVRSIPEYVFVILSQRKACAGLRRNSRKKNRSDNKMAAPEASVHLVRNRLCCHFFLYQTNESCSEVFQEG